MDVDRFHSRRQLSFWNLGLRYSYGDDSSFCRRKKYGECDYFSRGAPSKYIGLSLSDGLWAFALAFKCMHERFMHEEAAVEGAMKRFAAFDPHDAPLRGQLMACLTEEWSLKGRTAESTSRLTTGRRRATQSTPSTSLHWEWAVG